MRKLFRMIVVVLFFGYYITSPVQAQEDLAKYLPAGPASAEKLIKNYIEGSADAIGIAINNGWYHSAKVHKKWGFDLSIAANLIMIEPADEYYSFNDTGISDVVISDNPSDDQIPTTLGPDGEIRILAINDGSANNGYRFEAPEGLAPGKDLPLFNAVLMPTLQLGLGLPKNTELKIRITPNYKINQSKQGNWGIGVMHDLKQHIGALKLLPLDLSVFAGYVNHSGKVDLSNIFPGNNQEGVGKNSSFTAQLIVGRTLPWFSVFGGVGYSTYKLKFDVNGTYTVDSTIDGPLPSPLTYSDPFSYEFSNGGAFGKAGLRFKAGPVVIWGEYALFKIKNTLTLGLAFSSKE